MNSNVSKCRLPGTAFARFPCDRIPDLSRDSGNLSAAQFRRDSDHPPDSGDRREPESFQITARILSRNWSGRSPAGKITSQASLLPEEHEPFGHSPEPLLPDFMSINPGRTADLVLIPPLWQVVPWRYREGSRTGSRFKTT